MSTTDSASSTVPAGTFDHVIAGDTPPSAHVFRSGIAAPSTQGVTSVKGSGAADDGLPGTDGTEGSAAVAGGGKTGSWSTLPDRSPHAPSTNVRAAANAAVRARRVDRNIRPERSHG